MLKKNQAGNNRYLRQRNRTIILNYIRQKKKVSRIELTRLTNLSPTAIGLIISNLLEEGYIHEIGTARSTGGRKPKLLELKPGSYYSIGFDIDVDSLHSFLIDLTGRVYRQETIPFDTKPDVDTALAVIKEAAHSISQTFETAALLGVGISVPGVVNHSREQIVQAPNLGWKSTPFSRFTSLFPDHSLYIENEANASAICEHWQGSAGGKEHFICINISSGIGAGIFVNGKIYHGARGSAGEIGHNVVEENGPLCNCGKYGCLETLVSPTRLVEKARRLVKQGTVSRLSSAPSIDHINMNFITKLAGEGDEEALMILKESARYLGIGIAAIVNTLNPEMVIIGKSFCQYAPLVLENMQQVIKAKVYAGDPEVVSSEFAETSSALGAAILPLQNVFLS